MGFDKPVSAANVIETNTDVGDPNDTTTETLHGKLGTDAELSDNSIFDLLGGSTTVQGFPKMLTRATAALPGGAAEALFTITGGNIQVLSIIGEVTVAPDTANATKLVFNPTETGASSNICAALDINAKAIGTLLSVTGTIADAMKDTTILTVAPADNIASPGFVFAPGTIDLDCVGTDTTARIEWHLVYRPLEAGAVVVAS